MSIAEVLVEDSTRPEKWVRTGEAKMLVRALDTQLLTMLDGYRALGYPFAAGLALVRYVMDALLRQAGAGEVAEPELQHDNAFVHGGQLGEEGVGLMRRSAELLRRLLIIWSEARTLGHVVHAFHFWHVRTRLCLDRYPKGPEEYVRWRLGEYKDRRPLGAFGRRPGRTPGGGAGAERGTGE